MASTVTGLRCSDCMGNLEFDKARKIWICPYCGKEYERDLHVDKVQIDGVAGTNDVVRATLSDIAKYDFASAQKNLSECERVNPNHAGTIISNICFYLFNASVAKTDESRQQYLAKTTYYAKKLYEEYSDVYEDEKKLYDYLNNPDLYAILYIAFNSIGNKQREEIIYNYLQIQPIVDPRINKSLLTISLKKELLEDVDVIVNKLDFIDKRSTLYEILRKYPDGVKKKEYIKMLFEKKAFTDRDENLILNYLKTTKDLVDTKFEVLTNAYKLGIPLNITNMLSEIFENCTSEEEAKNIFSSLSQMKLKKDDVQIILDYCLSNKCPNAQIGIMGLNYLKESGSLFEVDDDDIISFLSSGNYQAPDAISIVKVMLDDFVVSTKSMDQITSFAMLECKFNKQERFDLINVLFEHTKSITIKTLNDYILKVGIDKELKIEIIKKVLALGMNKAYFNNVLSDYMKSNVDEYEIKVKIIFLLMDFGLRCTADDLTKLLLSFKNSTVPLELLEKLKNYNVSPDADTLAIYFKSLSDLSKYDTDLVDYLLRSKIQVDGACIERYLLTTKDAQTRKFNITNAMLNNCITKNFSSQITFMSFNKILRGNLAQAYLLTSDDDASSKLIIVKKILNFMKLQDPMILDNKPIKFKKFIMENKNNLDKDLDKLCEELGVYKLFF